MKTKLDKNERAIEMVTDSYRPVSKRELQRIERVLNYIRRTRKVNIRIPEVILDELKKRSQEEGIPYQTLISSVLQKYVTNRLLDEKAVRKSMELLVSAR
jgi:predicted DNA binding CopG/RHH family protein